MIGSAENPGPEDRAPWANLTGQQQAVSAAIFVVAYVLAAQAATAFDLPNGVSPWYPPAAVMFAYLLIAGPRYLPVAAVVSIVSDIVQYPDSLERQGASAIVLGATAVAAVYAWGAWVLRHNRLDHAQLRQFGWFATIGVAACPLLASTAYALVQVLTVGDTLEQALDAASTFWIGDSVAIASIVPFVLLLAYTRRHGVRTRRIPTGVTRRIEIVAQAVAVVVVPLAVFAVRGAEEVVPFLFLAMIPVIWVALRQNLLVAAAGVLVTNTVVAVGARIELGVGDDFVAVQTLMLTAALAALYAGAVRRTENEQLIATMESESRYRTLVENTPALVARFDPAGELLLAAGRLDPATPHDAAIAELARLADRWSRSTTTTADETVTDLEWTLPADRGMRWLETRAVAERSIDGDVTSILTVTSDRTSIRLAADELRAVARRDALTGLPNRIALEEALDGLTAADDLRTDATAPVALVAIALDRADTVLAGVGRNTADAVATAVAARIRAALIDGDVLARTGPTSYAVLMRDDARPFELATSIVGAMAEPCAIDGEPTYLRVSAGFHARGDDGAGTLLEHAELAVRFAQEAGGARVSRFEPAMSIAAADTRSVIHGLRGAIERDELVVHYQPIVSLIDGTLLGAEALVRWQRPGHGVVGPVDFIEIAERSGIIDDIGAVVEQIATAELVAHRTELPSREFALNLNVSANQLTSPAFPDRIVAMLGAFAQAGMGLRLELTETAILADPTHACAVLADLRDEGATIVLDDFGTGFSAISWLHQLPVDAIKLDRGFVTGLPDDRASLRIARMVTALANELQLDLTAEGIETEPQRSALLELGCTRAQGFLFARPEPLTDFLAFAAAHGGADEVAESAT